MDQGLSDLQLGDKKVTKNHLDDVISPLFHVALFLGIQVGLQKLSKALALLCFNTSDHLSYDQLQERTQIPSAELQLTLQSLSLHKTVKFLLHRGGKLNQGKRVKSGEGMWDVALSTPTPPKNRILYIR